MTTKATEKSVFEVLNSINCNGHTEERIGGKGRKLTYLSWAWAWAEVKKAFPSAFYTIYENADGMNYHTDGRTAWVKTGVTIEGIEHIEYLPVLDKTSNASLPLEAISSWDVNKAIQRSLTKACARHGLGLYIYAGEDLPEVEVEQAAQAKVAEVEKAIKAAQGASTVAELTEIWQKTFVSLQGNQQFKAEVTKRGTELKQSA